MESSLKVATVNIPAATHTAQDSVLARSFRAADGSEAWVGAVSDGCSSASESKTGSQWHADTFCAIAEQQLAAGHRGEQLGWQIIRHFLQALLHYACDLQEKANDTLITTLLGVVADAEQIVLVIAGSGRFSLNGSCYEIYQRNGDLYPIYAHNHPDCSTAPMREIAQDLFRVLVLPTAGVRNLTVCSDGMDLDNLFRLVSDTQLRDNPQLLVDCITRESETEFREWDSVRTYRYTADDTAVLALANPDYELLFDPQVLHQLCHEYSQFGQQAFFAKRYGPVAAITPQPVVVPAPEPQTEPTPLPTPEPAPKPKAKTKRPRRKRCGKKSRRNH